MSTILWLLIRVSAGLAIAVIIWYAGKRRLYVVVPKLFAHSILASRSRTVELTILNRGYRSEEGVRIELDPHLTYNLIASTNPAASMKNSTLNIERVSGGDEITVLFLAEQGEFGKKSIAEISSKECKGTVVEKLENVPPAFGSLMGGVAGILIYSASLLWFGWVSHETVEIGIFEPAYTRTVEIPEELAQLGWRNMESFVNSKLYEDSEPKAFPVAILEAKRENEIVVVTLGLQNDSPERLEINGKLISPVEDIQGLARFGDAFFHDALLFPGQRAERTLKIYLPQTYDYQIVIASISIRHSGGALYNLEKDIELTRDVQ